MKKHLTLLFPEVDDLRSPNFLETIEALKADTLSPMGELIQAKEEDSERKISSPQTLVYG